MSYNRSDNDDDLETLLADLAHAYGDLAGGLGKQLPVTLNAEIRDLGQRIEGLMELVELESEDPELGPAELVEHNEVVLAEVSALMARVRELKSCARQHSR